jgi:hypothetical protein
MTETPVMHSHTVKTHAYVALGVSVLTSAFVWYFLLGRWPSPEFVFSLSGLMLSVVPLGGIAGIILDILAVVRGGANRVIGVVGGVILVSPAAYFALVVGTDLIWPPN